MQTKHHFGSKYGHGVLGSETISEVFTYYSQCLHPIMECWDEDFCEVRLPCELVSHFVPEYHDFSRMFDRFFH